MLKDKKTNKELKVLKVIDYGSELRSMSTPFETAYVKLQCRETNEIFKVWSTTKNYNMIDRLAERGNHIMIYAKFDKGSITRIETVHKQEMYVCEE